MDETPNGKQRRRRWLWGSVVLLVSISAVWWWRTVELRRRQEAFLDHMRQNYIGRRETRPIPRFPIEKVARLFAKSHYIFSIETEPQAQALLSGPLPDFDGIEIRLSAKLPRDVLERVQKRIPSATIQ